MRRISSPELEFFTREFCKMPRREIHRSKSLWREAMKQIVSIAFRITANGFSRPARLKT